MSLKKVLIDPGHSDRRHGTFFEGMKEEELNRRQAVFLQRELARHGLQGVIYDPPDDDLWDIGQHAKGFQAFVSLHLNASPSRKANYSCTIIHRKYQKDDSLSAIVASRWAIEVGSILGIPVYRGTSLRGVMPLSLTVLNSVSITDCPIFFTSEACFMDAEKSFATNLDRLELAMKAGARVLKEFLK